MKLVLEEMTNSDDVQNVVPPYATTLWQHQKYLFVVPSYLNIYFVC